MALTAQFVLDLHRQHQRLFAELAISSLILVSSLIVLWSKKCNSAQKHWASWTIGLILGFWLHKR